MYQRARRGPLNGDSMRNMTTHESGPVPRPSPKTIAAQKAVDTRWGHDVERATHQGVLNIDGATLDCVVLEDGRRIISQASIMSTLGRSTSSGRRTRNDNRPPFLEANNLVPYITPELAESLVRVDYRVGDAKGIKSGYNAEILPRVCNVYLSARADGVLIPNQKPAAEESERVVRALSLIGITALVDEATGYQETRAKNELQKLLEAYIAEDFRPWMKRFPEVFFKEVYRLYGWEFKPGNHKHPGYTGKFINQYIYDAMPDGVLDRLRELNPPKEGGGRSRKHHQHLTEDHGVRHLEQQIQQTITLMKASGSKDEFKILFDRVNAPEKAHQTMIDWEAE